MELEGNGCIKGGDRLDSLSALCSLREKILGRTICILPTEVCHNGSLDRGETCEM
jgi:hypothetical protein